MTPQKPSGGPADNPLAAAALLLGEGRLEDAARLCLGVVKEAPETIAAWSL